MLVGTWVVEGREGMYRDMRRHVSLRKKSPGFRGGKAKKMRRMQSSRAWQRSCARAERKPLYNAAVPVKGDSTATESVAKCRPKVIKPSPISVGHVELQETVPRIPSSSLNRNQSLSRSVSSTSSATGQAHCTAHTTKRAGHHRGAHRWQE
jgi:hypothetical protein